MTGDRTARPTHDLACTPIIRGAQKAWFEDLRRQVERGAPYVFTDAYCPHEILEAFELPHVINEWWSGIVAAKRQSARYFDRLEALGFHSGLERYTALGLATVLDNDPTDAPWGGLPKPAFICASVTSARPEAAARMQLLADAWGVPLHLVQLPASGRPLPPRWWTISRHGWEQLVPAEQLNRMVAEYRDLIEVCEQVTGRPFEIERLRSVMDLANEQQSYFEEIRGAMVAGPAAVSMSEQVGNVMTIQWRRGSSWSTDMARLMRDEILSRADAGIAICPNERFRLTWFGAGMWQNTGFYRAFEQSHGVVFVRSMYMSIAIDGYPRFGADPLRALASRYCALGLGNLEWDIADTRLHRCDGVVTVAGSIGGRARAAFAEAGIPVLVLDVDLVDGRTWNEEKIHAQMSNFIENTLEPRRRAEAQTALAAHNSQGDD